jgi:predicted transcriptional regulator of viral defense system
MRRGSGEIWPIGVNRPATAAAVLKTCTPCHAHRERWEVEPGGRAVFWPEPMARLDVLSTQAPQTVFCSTTRKKNPVTYRDQTYRYVLVKPHKFFGDQRELVGGLRVLVADEAKAVVDSLDQSRYASGLSQVATALSTALPDVEVGLLVDDAIRMADKRLAPRRYLLEQLGRPTLGLPVSQSPVALDPERPRRGVYEARWHLVVSVQAAGLFPPGIG